MKFIGFKCLNMLCTSLFQSLINLSPDQRKNIIQTSQRETGTMERVAPVTLKEFSLENFRYLDRLPLFCQMEILEYHIKLLHFARAILLQPPHELSALVFYSRPCTTFLIIKALGQPGCRVVSTPTPHVL